MSSADCLAMLKEREDRLVNRRESPAKVEELKKVRLAIAALEGRLRTRDESRSESRSESLPASPPSRAVCAFFARRAGFGAGFDGDREDAFLFSPPDSSGAASPRSPGSRRSSRLSRAASGSDAERSDAGAGASGAGDSSVALGFSRFSPLYSGWKGHALPNRKWSVGVKSCAAHVEHV